MANERLLPLTIAGPRRDAGIFHRHRQPLQDRRGSKKLGFESRLKRVGLRLADPKSRTNFRLAGAMEFHVDVAAFCKRRTHSIQSELRRIAIAAEMSKHNPIDFAW